MKYQDIIDIYIQQYIHSNRELWEIEREIYYELTDENKAFWYSNNIRELVIKAVIKGVENARNSIACC